MNRLCASTLRFLRNDALDNSDGSHDMPCRSVTRELATPEVCTHSVNELLLCLDLFVCILAALLELRAAENNKDDEHDSHENEKSKRKRKDGVREPVKLAARCIRFRFTYLPLKDRICSGIEACSLRSIARTLYPPAQNVEDQHRD